jgi:hypothetical protein
MKGFGSGLGGLGDFQQRFDLERLIRENPYQVFDDYTVTTSTELRSLSDGATIAEMAAFICTFISDMQKRGTTRTAA